MESGNLKGVPIPASLQSLQLCARHIEEETVCRAEDLPLDGEDDVLDALLNNFPILLMSKSSEMCLLLCLLERYLLKRKEQVLQRWYHQNRSHLVPRDSRGELRYGSNFPVL